MSTKHTGKKLRRSVFKLVSALIIVVLGGMAAYAMQLNLYRLPLRKNFTYEKLVAVWDWHNPTTYSKIEAEDTAKLLKDKNINTVFLDISVYQDYLDDNMQVKDANKIDALNKSIEQYIKAMNGQGIQVYAAAGHTDWSKPQNIKIPLAIQDFVYNYNKTMPEPFAGLELDIESYNQSGFAEASMTEKELVLNEFLDLLDEMAKRHEEYALANDNLMDLGFAIPYWFDNENQNIKSVSWQNKTGPVLYHILDRLNTLPSSNIVVMAYRNAAIGNDGIIFHSRTEVEYAQSRAPNVMVVIGAEITDVEPAKITFYDKSMVELTTEFKHVAEEFEKNGTYKGLAINDLEGLRNFK